MGGRSDRIWEVPGGPLAGTWHCLMTHWVTVDEAVVEDHVGEDLGDLVTHEQWVDALPLQRLNIIDCSHQHTTTTPARYDDLVLLLLQFVFTICPDPSGPLTVVSIHYPPLHLPHLSISLLRVAWGTCDERRLSSLVVTEAQAKCQRVQSLNFID